MYDTTHGTRVLHGAEARLFAHSLWSLTDDLRNFVPDSGGQSFNHLIGIPVLESLTAAQVLVLLNRISAYLLDPTVTAPTRTAVLDAAIAAVFQQASVDVESEIGLEPEFGPIRDEDTASRTRVAEASAQSSDPDGSVLGALDPESADMDTWQFAVEQLCERVLPDTDWGLEPVVMDVDPNQGTAVKGLMGIQEDYFIDIVADASVEDAATAWCDLMERITGWRPAPWRFGCGLPQPANAGYPPRVDVLPFGDYVQTKIHDKPSFQQAKPVLLRAVVDEMEIAPEDWSSYVDRSNGEVVGLANDVIAYAEGGGDPEDYIGNGTKECLELARRICDTEDFVPLPSKFDIHEWSIMRDFCDSVVNDSDRQELFEAVHGNGAFRHFQSTIDRLGMLHEWRCYKDLAMERIAIRWLEANSIQWQRNESGEAGATDEAPF